MSNKSELNFIDTLDFLYLECLSRNPEEAVTCRMNTALGILASIFLPVVMLAGFIGNGLTSYIYLWKLRPLTRHGVYYSAIAIADNCCLFFIGLMWMFLAKGLPWISGARLGYFIINTSENGCRAYRYFESLSSLASSSMFFIMVIDRSLSVYFPFRFNRVPAKTAVKTCVIVILIEAGILFLINLTIGWVNVAGYTTCTASIAINWLLVTSLVLRATLLYPPTLMFVCILIANVLLIHKMRQIASERTEIRADHGDSKLANTVICVALSVILLVSSVPSVCFTISSFFTEAADAKLTLGQQKVWWDSSGIGKILVLFNQSVNWIVLMWRSASFRRAILPSFCIDCKKPAAEYELREGVRVPGYSARQSSARET